MAAEHAESMIEVFNDLTNLNRTGFNQLTKAFYLRKNKASIIVKDSNMPDAEIGVQEFISTTFNHRMR